MRRLSSEEQEKVKKFLENLDKMERFIQEEVASRKSPIREKLKAIEMQTG